MSDNGCITQAGPYNYPDVLVQPDLEIFANDITFSNPNPATSGPLEVSAVVHNNSDYFAQNFVVNLRNQFDTNLVFTPIVVSNLAPHASTTVTWNITTPAVPAWCPMEVSIDYTNVISESNELNNSAIRPFINGNYNLPGGIAASGTASPSVAYTTQPGIGLYGSAHYFGTAVPLPDSSVAGATVTYTILETGATYSTYTNSGGTFSTGFPSPGIPGTYHIQGTITDFTLTGSFTAEFTLVLPPVPVFCTQPNLVAAIHITSAGVQNNPAVIVQGNPMSGNIVVTNTGTGATNGTTILQWGQTGGTPLPTHISVPALAPGASFTTSFSNLVFNTPGSYSLCLLADKDNTEMECNENDNNHCRLIHVLPALPDIYPYYGPGGNSPVCTQSAPSFTLYNGGGIATGSFQCAIIVRKDTSVLDTLYHTVADIPNLQFYTFTSPYVYPASGNYSLELLCDIPMPSGVVTETIETNNTGLYYVNMLECLPNLTLLGCESFDVQPSDPVAGANITLLATIHNNGNAPVSGTIPVVFNLSGGSSYTGTYTGTIAPNQTAQVTVTASSVMPATQSLTATVDPQESFPESNETDNSITNNLCWDFQPVSKCVLGSNFWDQPYHVNSTAYPSVAVNVSGLYDAASLKVRFLVSGPGISGTVNLGDATINNLEQTCGCPAVAGLP
ncbi:MAG: hypothetical protein EOP49_20765, partial [Sphingobacteriales bacterium]